MRSSNRENAYRAIIFLAHIHPHSAARNEINASRGELLRCRSMHLFEHDMLYRCTTKSKEEEDWRGSKYVSIDQWRQVLVASLEVLNSIREKSVRKTINTKPTNGVKNGKSELFFLLVLHQTWAILDFIQELSNQNKRCKHLSRRIEELHWARTFVRFEYKFSLSLWNRWRPWM